MLEWWSIPFTLASGGSSDGGFALDLLIVLAAAASVPMFFRRLRVATIPGYLVAGAIIGPAALALVRDSGNIDQIKSLAVVMLMFTIGLHLDVAALAGGLVHIVAVGVASTLGTVVLAWPVAALMGVPVPAALAIAMAMSMSSTAVVLRLLTEKRETHRMHGRLCVGVSIVQDLLALAMLAALPLLGRWAGAMPAGGDAEHTDLGRMALGAATALGAVALLIAFGRFVLPRLLKEASREPSGEATLVLSSAVALGAAVLTASQGFSPELGAFLAGFLLSSTPFRYQLAGQLSPLRDLFMAVFFTAVGLQLDARTLVAAWPVVLIGLPALVIIKAGMIGVCTWAAGATAPVAGRTGLSLAPAGEFSIVILGLATAQGVIEPNEQTVAITLVVLSLMVAPSLYTWGQRLQPTLAGIPPARWRTGDALREKAPAPANGEGVVATGAGREESAGDAAFIPTAAPPKARRAIIAGFGVVGRAVADHLEVHGVPFTIVELNARTVETQEQLGRSVVFGDIGNPAVLEHAGIHEADTVFLTIPDDDATARACQAIRQLAPHVFIAARTTYLSTAFAASAAGADDVTIAEVATAEAMAKRVLSRLKG
ncbi:MAG: cation:proton antiporter [Phycisphaerae bacterium]|nr:cation:proton antiporter [Phycisphaerae bacterium]